MDKSLSVRRPISIVFSLLKVASKAPLALTEKRDISIEKIIKKIEGKSTRESKELLEQLRSVPKAKTYLLEIDEEAWQLLQEIKKSEGTTVRDGDITKKIFKEKFTKIQAIKENEKEKAPKCHLSLHVILLKKLDSTYLKRRTTNANTWHHSQVSARGNAS